MIDPVSLQMIRDVVTIFGVIAGLTYYLLTVRNANKARKTQIVMQLRNDIQSRENNLENTKLYFMEWDSFEDFYTKYDATVNPENYALRAHLWGFYESVGYMLYQGLIDVETVYNILGSYQTLVTWNKFRDVILEQRKFYDNPHWYRWFEYLASEISKERVRQGLPPDISDADKIYTRK
jgi:hypothetical protein